MSSPNEVNFPTKESIAKLLTTENIPNLIVDHEPLLTIPPALEYISPRILLQSKLLLFTAKIYF